MSLRLDSPAFWNQAPTRRPLATAFYGTQNDRPDQWDDSATDGGIAAVSYKLTESLHFGPGIGVMTEYQRRSTVFPVFLIDWQISDRLALTAGRGLGMRSGPGGRVARTGPGVQATYRLRDSWDVTFGFRYERSRFNLVPQPGLAPGRRNEDPTVNAFLRTSSYRSALGSPYMEPSRWLTPTQPPPR